MTDLQLPQIWVRFENVTAQVDVPKKQAEGARKFPCPQRQQKETFTILNSISGAIRPGTLTLVLAPPGHGKSAYLKAISGQLSQDLLAPGSGSVEYNGITKKTAKQHGVFLGQLCQHMSQANEHSPFLQVGETLELVYKSAMLDPRPYGLPEEHPLSVRHKNALEDVVELLHLDGCRSTIVGNDMRRGISGGEARRLTIGEALLTNARLLALDEPSTGLDSAVTASIIKSLKERAARDGLSVVIALLQPGPEVVEMFDDIVLLREGSVVYHGPTQKLRGYLQSMGYDAPAISANASDIAESRLHQQQEGGAAASAVAVAAAAAEAAAIVAATTAGGTDKLQIVVPPLEAAAAAAAAVAAGSASTPSLVTGTQGSQGAELADWVIRFLATPGVVAAESVLARQQQQSLAGSDAGSAMTLASSPVADIPLEKMARTTPALTAAWKASPIYHNTMSFGGAAGSTATAAAAGGAGGAAGAPTPAQGIPLLHPWLKGQYAHSYSQNFWYHVWLLVQRQFLLMKRNPLYLRARLMGSIIMAIVLGGLYWQRTLDQGPILLGLFLNSVMNVSFSNLGEMATLVENKSIAYKAVEKGVYPGGAFVLASMISHLPVALLNSSFSLVIYYWMSGMTANAGTFFFYLLILLLTDIFFRNMMAIFCYYAKSLAAAQAMPMPLLSLLILFAGFLISPKVLEDPNSGNHWLLFMYWLDYFAWAVRALAQNEFLSERYQVPVTLPGGRQSTLGLQYLEQFGMLTDGNYMWYGVAFAGGCCLLVTVISYLAFRNVRYDKNIGSVRSAADADNAVQPAVQGPTSPKAAAATAAGAAAGAGAAGGSGSGSGKATAAATPKTGITPAASAVDLAAAAASAAAAGAAAGTSTPGLAAAGNDLAHEAAVERKFLSTQSSLPFSPMTLVFKDITYSVKVPGKEGQGGMVDKVLLQGINGYARPGELCALMGASGAGKSTLLDVLASRKSAGSMTGQILLNGYPKDMATFNRITGYVEQNDLHMPLDTVREALEFSAALRLPASVTPSQRRAFVEEILDLLEMREIEQRKVGKPNEQDGLAPAERKKLTIAVELAANPQIIFADEPTSGLDSKAAASVMRVLRNIANTGRTVICTIHQPSSELFLQFDTLLLLQRGGYQVYLGPLGVAGKGIISYLGAIPGIAPYEQGTNPSSWMLDVLQSASMATQPPSSPSQTASASAAAAAAAASAVSPAAGAGTAPKEVELTSSATATASAATASAATDAAATDAAATAAAAAAASAAESAITHAALSTLTGKKLQSLFLSSPVWQRSKAIIDSAATPAAGSTPVFFDSLFSRSWGVQFLELLKRAFRNYKRNKPVTVIRLAALLFMQLLYGTVYYKIADSVNSQAGVQSLLAAVFMSVAFAAMMTSQLLMAAVFGIRSTFYRETLSYVYDSSAYTLANFLVEVPFGAGIVLAVLPVSYFMMGLSATASTFFFHYLVSVVLLLSYAVLGTAIASGMKTFESAQGLMGPLGAILFIWGGMWSPPGGMAPGLRWITYIDPIYHAFTALEAPHFYCYGAAAGSAGCPNIVSFSTGGMRVEDRYSYFSRVYDITYDMRWPALGYLSIFIAVFLVLAMLFTKYVRHIVR